MVTTYSQVLGKEKSGENQFWTKKSEQFGKSTNLLFPWTGINSCSYQFLNWSFQVEEGGHVAKNSAPVAATVSAVKKFVLDGDDELVAGNKKQKVFHELQPKPAKEQEGMLTIAITECGQRARHKGIDPI